MTRDPVSISVVVPLFNGEKFVGETLDSLAAQTEGLREVVVVDDGSTDAGPPLVERHSIGARLIRQDNRGVAVARNRGALAATGSHIAFLDQDDLWLPTRHARLLRWYSNNDPGVVLVTTCTSFVSELDVPTLHDMNEGLHRGAVQIPRGSSAIDVLANADQGEMPPTIRQIDTRELLGGPPSVTASFIVDRELWLTSGGCFPLVRSADDYVGLLAVSMLAPLLLVDEPSLAYRVHPASTSMTTSWNLPLLTTIAAVRHGDRIVRTAEARDPTRVPRLRGEAGFFLGRLGALAATGSRRDVLDAIACVQLLGTTPAERRRVVASVVRTGFRRKANAFSRRIRNGVQ